VARRWLLCEEAVETARWAVAGDGWVVPPAVTGVVFALEVATFPANSAPFVHGGIAGAAVNVMGEEEASGALSVLDVRGRKFHRACFTEHVARYTEDAVSSVSRYGEEEREGCFFLRGVG